MHGIQGDVSPLHVIQQAAGSRDDNLGPSLQQGNLLGDALPAVQNGNPDPFDEFRQLGQFLSDLQRQLPGRSQHDFLDPAVLQLYIFQHWNAESAGLARARGRNGVNIISGHHQRNGPGLYGGRFSKAHRLHGLQDFSGKIHLLEACRCLFCQIGAPFLFGDPVSHDMPGWLLPADPDRMCRPGTECLPASPQHLPLSVR